MPHTNDRSKVLVCLCVAGLALAWLGLETLRLSPPDSSDRLIDMAALAMGGVAFLLALPALIRLLRPPSGGAEKPEAGPERQETASAGALPAALRCLDQPALVVSEKGRIVHANPAAAAWLDPLGKVSPRIGDVVEVADYRHALVRARGERRPPPALLRRCDGGGDIAARVADMGLQAGAVVVFDAVVAPLAPPARPGGRWGVAFDPDSPLAALPLIVLHAAFADGRPVEIATVKLAGGRVYPSMALDFLIARPEAGRAGRPFADVWPELARALTGGVVAAENALDLWAALQAEMRDAGFAPADPPPLVDAGRLETQVGAVSGGEAGAEPASALRLARRIAALMASSDGNDALTLGRCLATAGESASDALKPPANDARSGETSETS